MLYETQQYYYGIFILSVKLTNTDQNYYVIFEILCKISRPAMVILTENAVTPNHYFYRKEDIEMARFTAIPYAFIDRRDWNDICRGVSYA